MIVGLPKRLAAACASLSLALFVVGALAISPQISWADPGYEDCVAACLSETDHSQAECEEECSSYASILWCQATYRRCDGWCWFGEGTCMENLTLFKCSCV
jgi:hypothetical protein